MPELVVKDRRPGQIRAPAAVADLEEELSVQGERLAVAEQVAAGSAPSRTARQQLHAIDQSTRKAQPPVEIASPDRLARESRRNPARPHG